MHIENTLLMCLQVLTYFTHKQRHFLVSWRYPYFFPKQPIFQHEHKNNNISWLRCFLTSHANKNRRKIEGCWYYTHLNDLWRLELNTPLAFELQQLNGSWLLVETDVMKLVMVRMGWECYYTKFDWVLLSNSLNKYNFA